MDAITNLLTRGVDKIYPSREALENMLRSGKKLRLYQGFDPTGTQLHVGHAVALRKLRQFQDLGHHVIFLIGDGTGQAGDPSGKNRGRDHFMTLKELQDNARDYVHQAGKIVRFTGKNPVEILHNSDWLNKLTLVELLSIFQHFSWQQLSERDLFDKRRKHGEEINMREFIYPILQGYDSVAMNIDLELGGTDQTFNMLAGRQLVKEMQGREKFVMTVPLLTDSKGVKIGKTEGNVIGLTDPPNEFFGKIMALGDDAIIPCFTLLTDVSLSDIEQMKHQMEMGATNPMTCKLTLAHHLTAWLHSNKAADASQKEFGIRFQKGELTKADLEEVHAKTSKNATISEVLVGIGLAPSKSVAKRLVEQKAVRINENLVKDYHQKVSPKPGDIFKVGRKAVKIKK